MHTLQKVKFKVHKSDVPGLWEWANEENKCMRVIVDENNTLVCEILFSDEQDAVVFALKHSLKAHT